MPLNRPRPLGPSKPSRPGGQQLVNGELTRRCLSQRCQSGNDLSSKHVPLRSVLTAVHTVIARERPGKQFTAAAVAPYVCQDHSVTVHPPDREGRPLGWTCCAHPARGEAPRPGARLFKPLRQVIESINDTFKGQLDLERHGEHTPAGVWVRIVQRVLALTAAIWHNDHTSQRSGQTRRSRQMRGVAAIGSCSFAIRSVVEEDMSDGEMLEMYTAYLAACNDRAWETIADFVHSSVALRVRSDTACR